MDLPFPLFLDLPSSSSWSMPASQPIPLSDPESSQSQGHKSRTHSPNQIKQKIAKVLLWSSTPAPGPDNNLTPESVLSPFTKLVLGKTPQQDHPASPPPRSGQEANRLPTIGFHPASPPPRSGQEANRLPTIGLHPASPCSSVTETDWERVRGAKRPAHSIPSLLSIKQRLSPVRWGPK